MTSSQGTVYLLHFLRPYRHARHYLGWTAELERRLAEHRAGRGSPLIRAAAEQGIDFVLVRTWPDDPTDGRQPDRIKNPPVRPCPICRRLAAGHAANPDARAPIG